MLIFQNLATRFPSLKALEAGCLNNKEEWEHLAKDYEETNEQTSKFVFLTVCSCELIRKSLAFNGLIN